VFGQLHDLIGRMPKAVVLDLRAEPTIIEAHDGANPGDRPPIEELLDSIDDLREEFVFDCELVEC
jgi:peroxiredoxin Q/BCP